MGESRIVVLGATGGAGRALAELLTRWTGATVVVAGRRGDALASLASDLNGDLATPRVTARVVDLGEPEALRAALDGATLVLLAASTPEAAVPVAAAAARAGCDYLDLYHQESVPPALRTFDERFRKAGRLVVTQGGCHPGLPGALVRWAAQRLDAVRFARVGMAIALPREATSAQIADFAKIVATSRPEIYRDGSWRKASFSGDALSIDYPGGFGARSSIPVRVLELEGLPERLGIEELGCYAAGFSRFTDYVVTPLLLAGHRLRLGRNALGRWFHRSAVRGQGGASGVAMVLEAEGERAGRPENVRLALWHEDVYFLTAAPVVAWVRQYLAGRCSGTSGVRLFAELVEPEALLADLREMGAEVGDPTNPGAGA